MRILFFSFFLLYDLYIYLESVVTLPISSEEALGVYYTTVYVIRITNAIVVDCWNNLLSGRDSVIGSEERHSFNELPLQTSHTLRRYEMSKRKASVCVCVLLYNYQSIFTWRSARRRNGR